MENPITEALKKTQKRTLQKSLTRTLSMRTLERTLSLRTQKKTPKKNLSLKTLERSLSLMVLKRSLSPARNTIFLGMVMERVGDGGKFWLIFFHIKLTFFHQLILREGIFGKAALLRFLILYISCNKVTLCNSYHFNKLFLVLMMTKLCLNAILLKRQAPSQFTKGMKLVAT